jgi:hypothetical protein
LEIVMPVKNVARYLCMRRVVRARLPCPIQRSAVECR